MVLEIVVSEILNRYIAKYVENFDRTKLKIGIWGGDIALKNLKIRGNALDSLNLPVRLVYGSLGTLVIRVPWKNPYSGPLDMTIEDLYLLVAPKQASKYDEAKEQEFEWQSKQAALLALEQAHKAELEKDKPKANVSLMEKLYARAINNVQLKISNVHVRYEDKSSTGEAFAFGATLHELTVYSTDKDWVKNFVYESVFKLFKVANMDSLSVYMNCDSNLFSEYSENELKQQFRDNIAFTGQTPEGYHYVFGPISSMAKLKLNMNPEHGDPPFVIPKIDLFLSMTVLHVGLTTTQFQSLMKVADNMNRMTLGLPYRKYRPFNKSYRGNYKDWWDFAINSVLEVDVKGRTRTWTWNHIKAHRQLCNEYAEKYKEKSFSKKPSPSLVEACKSMEQKLDLFNLLLIRQRTQLEIDKIRKEEEERNQTRSGWWSSWWGGSGKEEDEDSDDFVAKIKAEITPEEKDKLYKAIGYQDNISPLDMPKEYEEIKLNFKLESLDIGLYEDTLDDASNINLHFSELKTIMLLKFAMVTCDFQQRPADNAMSLTAGMKELRLTGMKKRNSNVIPEIIESKITNELNLLDIFFETNPLDRTCDQRIRILVRPIHITYDADTIMHAMKVFTPKSSVNLSEIEEAAQQKMAQFKERSATGMNYLIEKKEILDIDIKFMPIIFVVPEKGVYKHGISPLIVVSLGSLHIRSVPRIKFTKQINKLHESGKEQKDILEVIMKKAYDIFHISVENIQIMVVKSGESWESLLMMALISEMHVLRPATIKVALRLCIIDDDPRLPKTKIDVEVPEISLALTEERMFQAMTLGLGLPLPEGNTIEPEQLKRSLSSASSLLSLNFTRESKAKKKSKPPTKIIQYTEMEMNFILNEFNISFNKTNDSIGRLDTDGIVKTQNAVALVTPKLAESSSSEMTFATPMVSNDSFEEYQSVKDLPIYESPEQIMTLKISHLEGTMITRTYETVAIAKLGAINLKQFAEFEGKNLQHTFIETPRYSENQEYLLTVTYTMANKLSPEFVQRYHSVEQLVEIGFSTLNVMLHQECLKELLTFIDGIQRKIDIINKSFETTPKDRVGDASGGFVGKLTTITEEFEAEEKKQPSANVGSKTKKGHKSKVVDSIKFKVIAKLNQVALLITTRKRPIASLMIQNFDAGVIVKTSYTELNFHLKEILVTDLNPKTIHSSILSILGKDALDTKIVMYNLEETSSYNSDDMKITADIGCMKIVYLNWFVTSVLIFLDNFQQAKEALEKAGAAATESAKQNAINAYEKATRIKLDVRVKAPIIVVPVDSQSVDGIALDLGYLSLTNTISELSKKDKSAPKDVVIDEIKVELKNFKLSKVSIVNDINDDDKHISILGSLDTFDFSYGLKSNMNIMNPLTCSLYMKRNLSISWYKDLPELDIYGKLNLIELNLFMEDYGLIMSIINRNFNEGQDEFCDNNKPSVPHQRTTPALAAGGDIAVQGTPGNRQTNEKKEKASKPHEQFKYNLIFDGINANLMLDNGDGLAFFGLYFLAVKSTQLVDGSMNASLVLCNIEIHDKRVNNKSKITKYLCRKDFKTKTWTRPNIPIQDMFDECFSQKSYMLELTVAMKNDSMFAEASVYGFELLLCCDFLMQLGEFFKEPEEVVIQDIHEVNSEELELLRKMYPTRTSCRTPPPIKTVPEKRVQEVERTVHVILHVEEPDIILVESLEDVNTNAIIFNAHSQLTYRSSGEKQLISGDIDGLKMFMCAFKPERREATKHYIIHPCSINLQGSTPEYEGLHISLKFSEIVINVSPATIELLNKAMLTFNQSSVEKVDTRKFEVDHSNIWKMKPFNEKYYWFIGVETAKEAFETNAYKSSDIKTEKCVVELPSVTLVVETGMGYYTTPLISFDTKMDAIVSNWSTDLSASGALSLCMNYYNLSLGFWEPLIEKNEHINRIGENEFLPWELHFNVSIESRPSDLDETVEEKFTKIKVHSTENLETTLSKTSLDLIHVLGEAFAQAVDSKGLIKPETIAPFIVENDTGFEINLNFEHGMFTLHESHIPKAGQSVQPNAVVFQTNDGSDIDLVPEMIKSCTISAGGRAFLQTKDLNAIVETADEVEFEYNLYVKVGSIDKEVKLPVSKSDKRFFPLSYDSYHQDPWGIISEVWSEYGTTIINIHGVVNVHNHFATKIKVFRHKAGYSTEKIFVGEIEPNAVFHVPLHAIYTVTKELFFSVEDYDISTQGIKWNDSPNDLALVRQIQCDPIDKFEILYMNVLREKTEVFFENTNKYKLLSSFYTINLRPPLYLRNALPINIKVSVAGSYVQQTEHVDLGFTSKMVAGSEHVLDYGEKIVFPGDILHLPTVKLSGDDSSSKSYLVVGLMEYLEKHWTCTTEISEDRKDLEIWKFASYDSEVKVELDLYVRHEDRFGSSLVTLYSPFWMINKTGLMLTYKIDDETIDVLYHPPEYDGPILCSFREKFFFDKKCAKLRVNNGDWSTKIPLDVAGSVGEVICKTENITYQIGVHNHLTHNTLTKQITFIPFYVVTNKCDFPIELQEQTRPSDPWTKIEPNQCSPLWPKNDSDFKIIAKVMNHITKAFKYTEAQCTLLQLENTPVGGLNVDVEATEGGVYITFTKYRRGDAPGLLINHTSKVIKFYEKGSHSKIALEPGKRLLYTWVDPTADKTIVFGKDKIENDLRRDGVGDFVLQDESKAFWVSFLDGLQRVLLFTEAEEIAMRTESSSTLRSITQSIEVRIHGIGISVVDNDKGVDIMYLGITSSGVIWESKKMGKKRFKQMKINESTNIEAHYQQYLIDRRVGQVKSYYSDKFKIDFEKMKLMKTEPRVLQRTFYPGVWVSMKSSPFQTQLHAKINNLQLDNQLRDCTFPVVLAPIAPAKSLAATTSLKPFMECSVVQRTVQNSSVKQYKYASVLIQEFQLKLDLAFLSAVSDMFAGKVTDEQAAKLFQDDVKSILNPLSDLVHAHSSMEQKNFYDNLHLGPLKIHLSLSLAGIETASLSGLSSLIQGIGITLTDANDVVFRLAFFERENRFFTHSQLSSEITSHYVGQGLKQFYVLVFGLDVLGNPYGLCVGIKQGVEDFFYEPIHGAIQGPGEFAEGLALGVKSLFGHTVGGAAGAVSKITGAMGKGLAALTFDDEYQKKRREIMNKRPANFHEGIARSGKGLVMGFVDGVTGVVKKPVDGAREEGFNGFFKGLGKGAIGLVARPTAGVVDFASGSLEAVKRATITTYDARRLRPPRFFHLDKILRPYCLSEAKGNTYLREVDKGKYATTDSFLHCEEIVPSREFAILSNYRIMYISKNELFGTWTIQWIYMWIDIENVKTTQRGVEIVLKNIKKTGFFSSGDQPNKIITVSELPRRQKLVEIIESQLREAYVAEVAVT